MFNAAKSSRDGCCFCQKTRHELGGATDARDRADRRGDVLEVAEIESEIAGVAHHRVEYAGNDIASRSAPKPPDDFPPRPNFRSCGSWCRRAGARRAAGSSRTDRARASRRTGSRRAWSCSRAGPRGRRRAVGDQAIDPRGDRELEESRARSFSPRWRTPAARAPPGTARRSRRSRAACTRRGRAPPDRPTGCSERGGERAERHHPPALASGTFGNGPIIRGAWIGEPTGHRGRSRDGRTHEVDGTGAPMRAIEVCGSSSTPWSRPGAECRDRSRCSCRSRAASRRRRASGRARGSPRPPLACRRDGSTASR
jgi:hypothetical protein